MKGTADPNLIVYFDGKYMPLRDAQVNILTHALHYGTGVFEGDPRALGSHRATSCSSCAPSSTTSAGRRTAASCAFTFLPPCPKLCAITVELMRRNAFHTNVYVRPLAYKSPNASASAPTTRMRSPSLPFRSANICTATKGCTQA